MAKTVGLAVGRSTDSVEVVAMDNALESLSFGSTGNIDEIAFVNDVGNRDGVAQFQFLLEVCREFGETTMGSGSCLFEVPKHGLTGMFLSCFVIGKLDGGITIILNRLHLRDNTWTSLNDGAWNIFSISTENGSHSDFLSN